MNEVTTKLLVLEKLGHSESDHYNFSDKFLLSVVFKKSNFFIEVI